MPRLPRRLPMASRKSVLTTPAQYGSRAWAFIAAFVAYHELACPEGELLSQAVDRGLTKHPVVIHAAVLITAAHLLNWLPLKADPYHWVYLITKGTK